VRFIYFTYCQNHIIHCVCIRDYVENTTETPDELLQREIDEALKREENSA